ncbi:hypothetical protein [Marinomonas flavescens]|uniref:hypothetical protein n=1 Tax=Marinomonas flavescens TaxID=2529379 RepID=UPI0010543533|nr:hypothetical protein [Marinomonas flavescens]
MNDWFMSNLGDPMLADESLNQIKFGFSSQCDSSKNANHMAVFFRHESIGGQINIDITRAKRAFNPFIY